MESNRSHHQDEVDRAMTPILRQQAQQQHRRTDSQSMNDHDNVAGSPISSLASLRQVSNRMISPSTGHSPSRHRRINSDSPSESALNGNSRRVSVANGSNVSLNLASSESMRAKDEEISALKAKQEWMKVTLALATSRGFVATPESNVEGIEGSSEKMLALEAAGKDNGNNETGKVVEALIQMKQELARSKVSPPPHSHCFTFGY